MSPSSIARGSRPMKGMPCEAVEHAKENELTPISFGARGGKTRVYLVSLGRQPSEPVLQAGTSTQVDCTPSFSASPTFQRIGSQPAIRAMVSIRSREVVTLRTLDQR